jgi:hypothetical protein
VERTEDHVVERLDIPLLGGPLGGREIDVEVDDEGMPPERLTETWLWFTYGSELLDRDLGGRYELEPVAGSGPPWLYVWIDGPAPDHW